MKQALTNNQLEDYISDLKKQNSDYLSLNSLNFIVTTNYKFNHFLTDENWFYLLSKYKIDDSNSTEFINFYFRMKSIYKFELPQNVLNYLIFNSDINHVDNYGNNALTNLILNIENIEVTKEQMDYLLFNSNLQFNNLWDENFFVIFRSYYPYHKDKFTFEQVVFILDEFKKFNQQKFKSNTLMYQDSHKDYLNILNKNELKLSFKELTFLKRDNSFVYKILNKIINKDLNEKLLNKNHILNHVQKNQVFNKNEHLELLPENIKKEINHIHYLYNFLVNNKVDVTSVSSSITKLDEIVQIYSSLQSNIIKNNHADILLNNSIENILQCLNSLYQNFSNEQISKIKIFNNQTLLLKEVNYE